MVPKRQKLALLGAAGGVLSLGAAVLAGGAFAQTPAPSTGSTTHASANATPNAAQQQQRQANEDQYLNNLARNLGVDRAKLDSALKQTAKDNVSAALQAGTITQSEADQLNQSIDSAPASLGHGPELGRGFGGDFGIRGLTGLQAAIDAAFQQTVGETQQQFGQEVRAGKAPAQVFTAHNTTAQAVGQAEVNAAKPILDAAVTAKTITQTQETDFLQRLQNGPGFGPGGPAGPGGRGGHGGPDGPDGPGGAAPAPGTGTGSTTPTT